MAELLARFGLAAALLLVFAASAQAAKIAVFMGTARTSWYGGPRDSGDNDRPYSGIPNTVPGFAFPRTDTMKGYYVVQFPNGHRVMGVHSDLGPGGGTGRGEDTNYTMVREAGYTEGNYPTDKRVRYWYVGKSLPVARQRAEALGARIPDHPFFGGGAAPNQAPAARAPAGSTAAAAPASADLLGLMLGALGGQQGPQPVPVTAPQMPSFAARPPWLS